ncbi:MAG: hypothetical protein AB7I04_01810 [Pseudomonadales bacterium]
MIRNFVYLDIEKLQSLSSQLFEGVTEYAVRETEQSSEMAEGQKGPIGSGRVLGDILRERNRSSEMRYLNDHAYAIFEEKTLEDGLVYQAADSGDVQLTDGIRKHPFIRIVGTAVFNDVAELNRIMGNFNRFGQAIARVTNREVLERAQTALAEAKAHTKDRNQWARLDQQVKELTNIKKLAVDSGLQQDEKYLEDLAYLFSYGYEDRFEVQIVLGETIYSADLNRDCLREKEKSLIRKYARTTEVEFVLFGLATQFGRDSSSPAPSDSNAAPEEEDEPTKMKLALMKMVRTVAGLEETFTGRLPNEVIVDPIALYTQLQTSV